METVESVLKKAVKKLEEAGIDTPQLDAEVILCTLLDVQRIKLHIYPEAEISREICQMFWDNVEKRLQNMPVQYIIRHQEFMGLDFWVEEGILIPRPDTEILVGKVLDIYKEYYPGGHIRIMDMGVGSGAISVSLAHFIKRAEIYAVDISSKALEVTSKNAKTHKVFDRINLLQGDLFDSVKNEGLENTFHIIVSNPPYIPRDVIETLDKEIRNYEPAEALDGGEDGLDFYRKIIKEAPLYLKDKAWLLFEIGFDQALDISNMMRDEGFINVEIIKDLSGHDRVVLAQWVKNP
ncbi:MAG: peptide chain release factor N(5)-glutamine methyltransferase [Clostridiales bacterium]|nr:peptide chain release factor N(5)-glutamine methyltransferase [Clostridiales bacterium]